ncbi:MAG: BamA/TamA family outer membrane protein, partial [Gemmatimonadota bacterium]|nr:BamA/TamA family outer membrane protein [Gemmatimonadota bacterium]
AAPRDPNRRGGRTIGRTDFPTRRRRAASSRLAAALLCAGLANSAVILDASAQEAPRPTPAELDSAAAVRADLRRPPPRPPTDAVDVIETPFRVALVPVRWSVETGAGLLGFLTRPEPAPPVRGILAARAWGLDPRLASIGTRSGLGFEVRLERFAPFFAHSGISIRGSQRHGFGIALGDSARGVRGGYVWRRDAEDQFWGLGSDSPEEAGSDFLRDVQELGAAAWVRPGSDLRLGLGVAFEDSRIDRGFDGGEPDLQDTFADDPPFGVGIRGKFVRLDASAIGDFTRRRGLQTSGSWLRLGTSLFRGVDGTDSDFHRFEGEARQYVPVSPGQALALRAHLEVNELTDGTDIPFYQLARLGGARSGPRGFEGGRFRDRTGIVLSAEWRYGIWEDYSGRSGLEGFLFWDEGGVSRTLGSFSTGDLRSSYGVGIRLVGEEGPVGQFYVGFSSEDTQVRFQVGVTF